MNQSVRTVLQLVLFVVIAGLSYWLYTSITSPYAELQAREAVTAGVRARMDQNRQMLIRFDRINNRFPSQLDSLVLYYRENEVFQRDIDSLFGHRFNIDSLIYSPRTGNRFLYTASDTGSTRYYKLTDPDNQSDFIGTDQGDVMRLNAASWE